MSAVVVNHQRTSNTFDQNPQSFPFSFFATKLLNKGPVLEIKGLMQFCCSNVLKCYSVPAGFRPFSVVRSMPQEPRWSPLATAQLLLYLGSLVSFLFSRLSRLELNHLETGRLPRTPKHLLVQQCTSNTRPYGSILWPLTFPLTIHIPRRTDIGVANECPIRP